MFFKQQQVAARLKTFLWLLVFVAAPTSRADEPSSTRTAVLPDIAADGACSLDLVRHHCVFSQEQAAAAVVQPAKQQSQLHVQEHRQQPKAHPKVAPDKAGKPTQQPQQPQSSAGQQHTPAKSAVTTADAAAPIKQWTLLLDATATAAAPQQEVESAALQLLSKQLKLSYPGTDIKQLQEGPQHAQCLRAALLHPNMGALFGGDVLTGNCWKELMSFYDDLAADSAKDYQLLAACAEDIITHCPEVPSTQLFICLTHSKHHLKRYCAAAVGSRIMYGAGSITWDQDLAANCLEDAKQLCSEDLESDMRLPSVGGFTMGCLKERFDVGLQVGLRLAADEQYMEKSVDGPQLSKRCQQAMFRRQMIESEDVRFSHIVSRVCAIDLKLHCSGIRPGGAEAYACLERSLEHGELGEDCRYVVSAIQELRVTDGRLDWRLRSFCRDDVTELCSKDKQYVGGLNPSLMLDDWDAPPGAGMNVTMCLRRQWTSVKSQSCKSHLRQLATAAFSNTLLDAPLLTSCQSDIQQHCLEPGSALVCLKGLLANGLKLNQQCADVLHERLLEAADNFDLLPELTESCQKERRLFCEGVPSAHGAVLDCLVDFREDHRFGEKCRESLTSQFILAVSDIRLMTSLQQSCASAVAKLCPNITPGSGRVIECLQQHSGDISSNGCRKQLMRLRGFAAHDYRLDFHLRQACAEDVTKFCAHVVPGNGRVHACLRSNDAKLRPACKTKVQQAEAREHQDLSLNPTIQETCKGTITQLCGKTSGSITDLVPCLQQHMAQQTFPENCRQALKAALARKANKYHLQTSLHKACDSEVERLCPEVKLAALAGQEEAAAANAAAAAAAAKEATPGANGRARRTLSQHETLLRTNSTRYRHTLQKVTTNVEESENSVAAGSSSSSAGDADSAELLCISGHLSELSPGCKTEVAAEVHRQMMVYMPGAPLTAACDQDAKKLCQAGSADVSAVLQAGSLVGCLALNTGKLSPGCWKLISLFDKGELQHAKQLAAGASLAADGLLQQQQQQDVATVGLSSKQQKDEKDSGMLSSTSDGRGKDLSDVTNSVMEKVTKEVHSQLSTQLNTEIEKYVGSVTKNAQSFGFMYGVLVTVLGIAVGAAGFALFRHQIAARGRHLAGVLANGGTLVVKDGNV